MTMHHHHRGILSVIAGIALFSACLGFFALADESTSTTSSTTSGTSGSGGGSSSSGSGSPSTTIDTVPPLPPVITASIISGTPAIVVSFSGAIDPVDPTTGYASGIATYKVFRNGTFLASVSSNSYTDTSVTSGGAFTYAVRAADHAGNESEPSAPASVTIQPPNTQAGAATSTETTTSASTTTPTYPVSWTVTVSAESVCISGVAKTIVYFKADPLEGGYFRLRSSLGDDRFVDSGGLPLPSASYYWEGKERSGYTKNGANQGSFVVNATPCPAVALNTTSTTAATPTPSTTAEPSTGTSTSSTNSPVPQTSVPTTAPDAAKPILTTQTTAPKETIETIIPLSPKPATITITPSTSAKSVTGETNTAKNNETSGESSVLVDPLAACHDRESCSHVCTEEAERVNKGSSDTRCAVFVRTVVALMSEESHPATGTPETEKAEASSPAAQTIRERIGARIYVDTDTDGLSDYDEINLYGTDPEQSDSNGDGVSDEEELLQGTDPLSLPAKEASSTPMTERGTSTPPTTPTQRPFVTFEDPRANSVILPNIATTTAIFVSSPRTDIHREALTLRGTSLPNAIITLYIFSDPIVVRVKADESGSWSYTLEKDLPDGSHEVYTAVTDGAGKILARSEPLPFVKQAAAITIGTGVIPSPEDAAPGFFSGISLYALLLVVIGIIGAAVTIVGAIIRRGHIDEIEPPDDGPRILGSGSAVIGPTSI